MSNHPPTPSAGPATDSRGEFWSLRIAQQIGLPESLNRIRVMAPEEEGALGAAVWKEVEIFGEDRKGNIVITPYRLDRTLWQKQVKKSEGAVMGGFKVVTYQVKRLREPKGDMKYQYPDGKVFDDSSPLPFFPPQLLEKFEKAVPIKTLVLTEGYFKAMKAQLCGIDCVGLPSITIFKEKGAERKGQLAPDIAKIIQVCSVKNVIILWDGDCRNFSQKDLEKGHDLTRRPYTFHKMAVELRERLKEYNVDTYFAAVRSEELPNKPKGIDDLLCDMVGDESKVAGDLLNFDGEPWYFHRMKLDSANLLYRWFALESVEDFFELHKQRLHNLSFYFRKKLVKAMGNELMQQEEYDFLPEGVDPGEFEQFGFYEQNCCYFMRINGNTTMPVSNFTMRSLFLIRGTDPKRVIELTNKFGAQITIAFEVADLVGLSAFKVKVEGRGNFLFYGKEEHLGKIKMKLFLQERDCLEIETLGWQNSRGFWAWANGIYTPGGEFLPVDAYGMVAVGDENYYLPMFSASAADVVEEYRGYRKFSHNPNSKATFNRWAQQFLRVYGDNGKIGILFYLVAIYRDIIYSLTRCTPLLFLFGQRGSGKGTMANSLMCLLGEPQDPLMLGGSSTVIGFMRKLAQLNNAIVWLDEFKNDIGEKKIESLKNIWDGIGTERGKKSNDNRTEVTKVTSAAMLSGQEMPNVEPALFSRVVLLEFYRADGYTEADIEAYNNLRKMEMEGLTSVTLELLSHRDHVEEKFIKYFEGVQRNLRKQIQDDKIEITERQVTNTSIFLTMALIMSEVVTLPAEMNDVGAVLYDRMKKQSFLMSASNEVQVFFEYVVFLLSTHQIVYGKDIQIRDRTLYLRLASIYGLYRDSARKQGVKPLDKGTLVRYFEQSKAFDRELTYDNTGKMRNIRFEGLVHPTNSYAFSYSILQDLYGVDIWANVTHQKEASENEDFMQISTHSS